MGDLLTELADPDNIFAHFSYVFLITSMLMRNLRNLRILALLSGLSAMAHFTFQTDDDASFVWEVMFVTANATQLILLLYRSRRGLMGSEERELMETVLRVEEPAQQRRLLDLITWRDVAVGEVLMSQGQKNPPLIYIASGAAGIAHDGQLVGVCGPGDFLGEMSLLTGEHASATVSVTNPMRIAVFDRDALARLSTGIPELARAFDHALNRGLAAKILRMNKAALSAA
jgi:CRP-like cAMP-binding protein